MMDCKQMWICGAMPGFLYHLNDPFSVALKSDET